jgi:transcriptional regulator with XRE-family HTH domain
MRVRSKKKIEAFCRLREALGMSQARIAARLNMSLGGWQQWEYGRRPCKGPALQAVLALCDETPDPAALRALFEPLIKAQEAPVFKAPNSNLESEPQARPRNSLLEAAGVEEEEPDYVRSAPRQIQEAYRQTLRNIHLLEAASQNGNHAAREALRMLAEMWGRAAFITRNPERSHGRRASSDKEVLRLLDELGVH